MLLEKICIYIRGMMTSKENLFNESLDNKEEYDMEFALAKVK